jgi:hypothetical protein
MSACRAIVWTIADCSATTDTVAGTMWTFHIYAAAVKAATPSTSKVNTATNNATVAHPAEYTADVLAQLNKGGPRVSNARHVRVRSQANAGAKRAQTSQVCKKVAIVAETSFRTTNPWPPLVKRCMPPCHACLSLP